MRLIILKCYSITLNDSLQTIFRYALGDNSFTSLYIPSSVTTIEDLVRSWCTGCTYLSSIVVDPDNPNYNSRNNCNAIITSTGELIQACKNTTIPDSVYVIGYGAMNGFQISKLILPNSVISFSPDWGRVDTLVISSSLLLEIPFWPAGTIGSLYYKVKHLLF